MVLVAFKKCGLITALTRLGHCVAAELAYLATCLLGHTRALPGSPPRLRVSTQEAIFADSSGGGGGGGGAPGVVGGGGVNAWAQGRVC